MDNAEAIVEIAISGVSASGVNSRPLHREVQWVQSGESTTRRYILPRVLVVETTECVDALSPLYTYRRGILEVSVQEDIWR
jgi:hypothetical protein